MTESVNSKAFWLVPGSPPGSSPASLRSLVFFQIASSALAVESLMWSLKDLRSGVRRGRAIMWSSGSPIHPRVTSGGPPGPSFLLDTQDAGIAAGAAASGRGCRRPPGPQPSARRGHIWKGLGPAAPAPAIGMRPASVTQSPRSLCGAAS